VAGQELQRLFGTLLDHPIQLEELGGFSKLDFNIIWISVLFTIRKKRNGKFFNNKMKNSFLCMKKLNANFSGGINRITFIQF